MQVEENIFCLAPPKYHKVAQNIYLVTLQPMGDAQLHFHVHQTILSQVLCVLVDYNVDTRSSSLLLHPAVQVLSLFGASPHRNPHGCGEDGKG